MRMVKKFMAPKIAIFFLLFAMNLCFAEDNGSYKEKYVSKKGKFELKIPVNRTFGGRTNEGKHSVSFIDDFCSLYRIDYAPLTEKRRQLLEKLGPREFLSKFMERVYMETFIRRRIPGAFVDFKEFLSDEFSGAVYSQIHAPRASICSVRRNGGAPEREDAKRGSLIYIINDRIYVVTTSLKLDISTLKIGLEDLHASQSEKLKKNTLSFAKTIVYR